MKTRSHMIVTAISATFVLLMGIGDEAVARGGGGGGGGSRGGGGGGFSRSGAASSGSLSSGAGRSGSMSGGSSAASASRASGRSQAAQTGSTNRSAPLRQRPRTRQRPSKAVSRLHLPIRPSGSQALLRTRRNGSNTRMKMSRPASRALPAGRKAGSKRRSPIRGLLWIRLPSTCRRLPTAGGSGCAGGLL